MWPAGPFSADPSGQPGCKQQGRVAQSVEQGIENPRVGGSIPSSATIIEARFAVVIVEENGPERGFFVPTKWRGEFSACVIPV